jgi:hypothetical protein
VDGGEDHDSESLRHDGKEGLDGMKNPKENAAGPVKDSEEEIFRKHGVQVTDMAKRGIRAIGILGGVRRQDRVPSKRPVSG